MTEWQLILLSCRMLETWTVIITDHLQLPIWLIPTYDMFVSMAFNLSLWIAYSHFVIHNSPSIDNPLLNICFFHWTSFIVFFSVWMWIDSHFRLLECLYKSCMEQYDHHRFGHLNVRILTLISSIILFVFNLFLALMIKR